MDPHPPRFIFLIFSSKGVVGSNPVASSRGAHDGGRPAMAGWPLNAFNNLSVLRKADEGDDGGKMLKKELAFAIFHPYWPHISSSSALCGRVLL